MRGVQPELVEQLGDGRGQRHRRRRGALGQRSECPNPGRSRAITSWRAASASSTGSQTHFSLPSPWISTSGGPLPRRT